MNSVQTEKGTVLPLVNLKGKSYLMVAHRLQWLSEKYPNYTIDTELLSVNDDQTVAKATVVLYDETGKVLRRAQATKRETKKDFNDHTEKAETAAIGRALAMLGLGTQHALSDLDEGERIVDSPVVNVKPLVNSDFRNQQISNTPPMVTSLPQTQESGNNVTKATFRKPAPTWK